MILQIQNLLTIVFLNVYKANAHAALYEPPNRSSVWRFPEFSDFQPVVNTNDKELFCGGFGKHHFQNGGKCGVCGDDWSQPRPRANESGGKYDNGILVRNYTVGSAIFTSSRITANHLGFFEFSLCPRNSRTDPEEEECFAEYPLPLADGSGFRSYPVLIGNTVGYFNATVLLPPRITCSACVLRWQYITGNNWGICGYEDGPDGELITITGVGCGPQEEFRGCADIGIFNN